MQAMLGTDFIVGSYCASRTMPGFAGQEPHIDYPYWDYHRPHSFPARINSSFPLNAQGTIVIDPSRSKRRHRVPTRHRRGSSAIRRPTIGSSTTTSRWSATPVT